MKNNHQLPEKRESLNALTPEGTPTRPSQIKAYSLTCSKDERCIGEPTSIKHRGIGLLFQF